MPPFSTLPKERAELLEELTGTEIYGQISAQVFEKHKHARGELDKLQAQASGVVLLSEEQQQALLQSLQALTSDENSGSSSRLGRRSISSGWRDRPNWNKTAIKTNKRWPTPRRRWLPPSRSLQRSIVLNPLKRYARAGRRCRNKRLRVAKTHQLVLQVNTFLHDACALRDRIRFTAERQALALQQTQAERQRWLEEHEHIQRWQENSPVLAQRLCSANARSRPAAGFAAARARAGNTACPTPSLRVDPDAGRGGGADGSPYGHPPVPI